MSTMRKAITLAAPAGPLPFSPAVRANGFVFVSGQASVDDAGQIVGGDLAFEFRRSFEGVQQVLAAADLTLDDVVQVRMYVRDPADLPEANRLYRDWFTPPFPARTTLTGCLPDTLRFEVDVVAVDR